MDTQQLIYEAVKEVQKKIEDVREAQIQQGSDIKENKENLIEHMRRTEMLEERVESLEAAKIGKEYMIKTIKTVGTFTGYAVTILGSLYGLFTWFSDFK